MDLTPSQNVMKKRLNLEQRIRGWIKANAVTSDQLAEKLGLLPTGGEVLLDQKWTLDTAFRIADAIGLDVEIRVGTGGD